MNEFLCAALPKYLYRVWALGSGVSGWGLSL